VTSPHARGLRALDYNQKVRFDRAKDTIQREVSAPLNGHFILTKVKKRAPHQNSTFDKQNMRGTNHGVTPSDHFASYESKDGLGGYSTTKGFENRTHQGS